MILFLTVGEYASGIYSSQILDVCKELSLISRKKVKLIAFISIRNFFKEKKRIKENYKNSFLLPMFPRLKYYKMNLFLLSCIVLFTRPKAIICRNAIPTQLGLGLKRIGLVKKVIMDGRAAEYEQFKEYNLTNDPEFTSKFKQIEMEAVNKADYRIAVSQKLVMYWQNEFNYNQTAHTIIPCTLNSSHNNVSEEINREKLGYNESDLILVYSGSSAQWQSFNLLFSFLEEQLQFNESVKVILMLKNNHAAEEFAKKYVGRVKIIWSKEEEVMNFLSISDYGILLRDETWTNKVASPVKFAEYLNAGLGVVISAHVGDFSDFVSTNNCGFIYDKAYIPLSRINILMREENKKLVRRYFDKKSVLIRDKYFEVLKKTGVC